MYCHYNILKNQYNIWEADKGDQRPRGKSLVKKQTTFKVYSGPVDIEFLIAKSPQELFTLLRNEYKNEELESVIDEENGFITYSSNIYGVSFNIRVAQFVDFDNGSYIMFEKIKPTKEKFDKFFMNHVYKGLLEALQ